MRESNEEVHSSAYLQDGLSDMAYCPALNQIAVGGGGQVKVCCCCFLRLRFPSASAGLGSQTLVKGFEGCIPSIFRFVL